MTDLDALFDPESIAFVGASPNSNYFRSIYENVDEAERERTSYFVNPNYEEVLGEPCYTSIADVPGPVDLAVLIVPAGVVPSVLEACCETGVGACLIASAGFSELGEEGRELQERIEELSERFGVPCCGPNTFGLMSAWDDFYGIVIPRLAARKGGVSVVVQSGGLLIELLADSIARDFGVAKLVDSGNEASVSTAVYVDYLLDDPETEVIVTITEAFTDPKRFLEVTRKAVERETPIITLKVARSEEASAIAASHTGSMTTADEVVEAMLRQQGVVQVDTLDDLIETIELFYRVDTVSGPDVAVLEVSGGGCALYTDALAGSSLELAGFSDDLVAELREFVPTHIGRVGNPIDLGGIGGWGAEVMDELYPGILRAVDASEDVDVVLTRMDAPTSLPDAKEQRLADIEAVGSTSEKAYVVASRSSRPPGREWIDRVHDAGVPYLQEYHKTVEALDRLSFYSEYCRDPPRAEAGVGSYEADLGHLRGAASAEEVKPVLRDFGFPMPEEAIGSSEAEAIHIATEIGFPVCLKVVSPDVPHKTDHGGVVTGVADEEGVRAAYRRVIESVSSARPDVDIDGVLVQEMVTGGVELLVGCQSTPFGQAVVVGMGGIYTELVEDTALRIAPVSARTAEEMLRELQLFDVLRGARGRRAVDLEALVDIVTTFSRFVAANESEVVEVDLNPVIATAEGAYVVDAMATFAA